MPRVREMLASEGWRHSPKDDEEGGTGYEHDLVRLELTYLERGDDGVVYTPLRNGRVRWPDDALGDELRELASVTCRLVSLTSLRRSKSSPRPDRDDAAKDRADFEVLHKTNSG